MLAGAVVLAALASGCSSKPAVLAWEQIPPDPSLNLKGAFPSVVAISGNEAMTVGFAAVEGALQFHAVSLHWTGASWVSVPVPGHAGESVRLLGVTRAADGTLWACGGARSASEEPASSKPIVYHYVAGAWSEVPLDELGNLTGAEFEAVAAGAGDEIRVVGASTTDHGIAARYSGGHWTRMTLPDPGGGSGAEWSLYTVGHARTGTSWYAAGGSLISGVPGGVILVDDGSGWRTIHGPGSQSLEFRALGFDTNGSIWLGGNYAVADSAQGVLYRYQGSAFTPTPITLQRSGAYVIYGSSFDGQGHGWVVGGRAPDDPFFASLSTGGTWVESLLETDLPTAAAPAGAPRKPARTRGLQAETSGGELFGVSIVSQTAGFASGQAEESGAEGGSELLPRLFRLIQKAETDKPRLPSQPL